MNSLLLLLILIVLLLLLVLSDDAINFDEVGEIKKEQFAQNFANTQTLGGSLSLRETGRLKNTSSVSLDIKARMKMGELYMILSYFLFFFLALNRKINSGPYRVIKVLKVLSHQRY